MKKTLLFLIGLLLSQYTFAACKTIREGTYFTLTSSGGSSCYRYYVSSGKMPVFTLKHKNGKGDLDLAVYTDSSLSQKIGSSSASGTTSELLTLFPKDSGRYLYAKVKNYNQKSGTYSLYAKQVDFVSKIGEVLAETAIEATIEWGLKALLGIDNSSSESDQQNVERASSTIMSMLQGKSLANTSRDLLIAEVKKELIGDGFVSDFALNYAIAIIDEIYEYY